MICFCASENCQAYGCMRQRTASYWTIGPKECADYQRIAREAGWGMNRISGDTISITSSKWVPIPVFSEGGIFGPQVDPNRYWPIPTEDES